MNGLILTAVCWLGTVLSRLTDTPPLIGTAFNPAVGLGLAGLLVFGPRWWPAVSVGCGLGIAQAAWYAGLPTQQILILGAGFGLAYGLQATFGRWLIRLTCDRPVRLVHIREIVRFLFLVGPAHTLVVSMLAWFAQSDVEPVWPGGFDGWLSDAAGGILFTPLGLVAVGKPRELWQSRRWSGGGTIVLTAVLIAVSFVSLRTWERRRPVVEFERQAVGLATSLQMESNRLTELLKLYAEWLTEDELRDLAGPRGRNRLADFHRMFPAVVTVFPLAAEAVPAEHLEATRQCLLSRRLVASPPHPDTPQLLSAFLPTVPTANGVSEYLGLVIDLTRVEAGLIGLTEPNLTVKLFDTSLPQPAQAAHVLTDVRRTTFCSRPMDLVISANARFVADARPTGSWTTSVGRLFATGLMVAALLALSGRTWVVEEIVRVRTEQLTRALAAQADAEAGLADAQRVANLGLFDISVASESGIMSDHLFRLFGYEPGEIPVTIAFMFTLIHPDEQRRFSAELELLRTTGLPSSQDYRILRRDGAIRVVQISVSVVKDPLGHPVRYRGAIIDVTEQRGVEAERQAMDARLKEMERREAVGLVAGGVAHEFNNLMTSVLGRAVIARDALGRDDPHLKAIEVAAVRAGELCQQMLAYAGRGVTERRPADLNQVVRDHVAVSLATLPNDPTVDYEPYHEPLITVVDPGQVRRLVNNLLMNAAESNLKPGGKIRVRTGRETVRQGQRLATSGQPIVAGVYHWIEVTDFGTGMTPTVASQAFEPFFTTKFTGRGLGLSAVAGIARGHGGGIVLDTAPDRGTTVRVYFSGDTATLSKAKAVAETPRIPASVTRLSAVMQPNWVAIVADDDPAVRELAAVSIQSLGFRVLTAETGRQAVDLFEKHADEVKLVVLDMMMPELGGRETFQLLRDLRIDLPILMMSGYAEADIAEEFTGGGPHGFLPKPFRPADLIAAARSVMASAVRLVPG